MNEKQLISYYKKNKKIFTIFGLFFLLVVSFVLTNNAYEKIPDVRIKSISAEIQSNNSNMEQKSEKHQYCSKKYNSSIITVENISLEETSVTEGDILLVKSILSISSNDEIPLEVFAWLYENELVENREGKNTIGEIYYTNENVKVYRMICFNQNWFETFHGEIFLKTSIERPAYIKKSKTLFVVLFLTIFVLLKNFFDIILKPFI